MIKINGLDLEEYSTFPGGEEHIKLPNLDHLQETANFIKRNNSVNVASIVVEVKIRSSEELIKLMLVKNALDIHFPKDIKGLKMLYMPYARQDRVCNLGEAFSAKAFADLINLMKFDAILTADVHSDIILKFLTGRVTNITVSEIFANKYQPLLSDMVLVAPDKGSYNKIKWLSQLLEVPFISATKVRSNGNILVELDPIDIDVDLTEKNLLIVDDICDGGGTFVALSKLLGYKNPMSINLYVTHGIFSRGLAPLRAAGIEKIYTTNSMIIPNGTDNEFFVWNL